MISRFLLYEQLSKISISLLMSLIVVRPERYANLLITIILRTHIITTLVYSIAGLTEEMIRKKYNYPAIPKHLKLQIRTLQNALETQSGCKHI